jgi:predicted kinase
MNKEKILYEVNNHDLVLIRGTSGAGKSTLATFILENLGNFQHFEADMYFMKNGVYQFDGTKLGSAHGWCQSSVQKALEGGSKVIVSNTFTTHREIKPYVEIAKSLGVPYMVVKCVGKWRNEHNVPDEVLQKMRDRWQDYAGEVTYEA